MKTKLFLGAVALAIAGWCNAADRATLTLYAAGCESANTIICDAGQQVNIDPVPENEHRHFVRWSDGNTDNPRLVTVTQDTTFTAEFAFNQYTISTEVNDAERGSVSDGTTAVYLTELTLTATANYGYHFARWQDGNTDNPRTVQITGNKTYTAVFAKNTYTITAQSANTVQGSVVGDRQAEYLDQITLTAKPNFGYHFTRWTDGNTDNPRWVTVTQDTTFTAEFAFNQYTISTEVNDAERGSVSDGATAAYLSEITLTATANYGYHFARWQDGNTDNPRTVQITGNKTYTAVFAKNTYTITAQSANTVQGSVVGDRQAEYLDQITLTAKPNFGYHFTRWTDGNTDNPRSIVLTCDTAFTAEFALTIAGQCGDNLYWQYAGHMLTISGTGTMYDYNESNMPWRLFRDTTESAVLSQGITHIGNNAFNGFVKLNKIELPSTLTSIGANAFAGCRKLYDIYSYAVEPPVADNGSFANYNVYLQVPCDNLQDYQLDAVFGSFKYIQCLGAENTTTGDDITVTPAGNEATFVWRADASANTYTLEICKDGVVFCTLVFNASGQLTSIAFAPSRNGQPRHAAEQTGDGFRFTVTGLSESTHYTFGMTVKDANNATLQTYTGEFNTTSGTATALDNAAAESSVAQKIVRNGQVLILRGGKTYTTTGIEVNE